MDDWQRPLCAGRLVRRLVDRKGPLAGPSAQLGAPVLGSGFQAQAQQREQPGDHGHGWPEQQGLMTLDILHTFGVGYWQR